jgi:hypothetical protein
VSSGVVFIENLVKGNVFVPVIFLNPTDDIPTLLWWWGLSAPETLRAILVVA